MEYRDSASGLVSAAEMPGSLPDVGVYAEGSIPIPATSDAPLVSSADDPPFNNSFGQSEAGLPLVITMNVAEMNGADKVNSDEKGFGNG